MEDYIDTSTGKKEEKIMKDFKSAMDDCLVGDPESCTIKDCLGQEFRPGVGYCKVHWKQKLDAEKAEWEKKKKADRKRQAKIDKSPKLKAQVELEQKIFRHFLREPFCFRCGQHISDGTKGHARLRAIQPAHPSHMCRRFETICKRCEHEGF